MQVMNTLYVTDHRARVGARHGSLEVRCGRELRGRYPLGGLGSVILASRAEITAEALVRCTRRGIRVAALSGSGRLRFVVGGATNGNVLLRVAQVRAADDPVKALELCRTFVAGKLQNQHRVLGRWASDDNPTVRRFLHEQRAVIAERLASLSGASTPDAVRGLEGDATRRYFKGLGAHLEHAALPFMFTSRNRRPPRDPVNALLGFVYGLLVVEVIGGLEAMGLDPQIGFLHGLRPGRPSLALDLVEELRPAVAERFCVQLLTRRQLGLRDFRFDAASGCRLTDDARQRVLGLWDTFRNDNVRHLLLEKAVPRSFLATIQATLLARHLRGDLPAYAPFVVER